ncbi:MAG: TIR domain-containing protein [Longimicrobiaceae bacterium]
MFISYSRTDIAVAKALVEGLSSKGVECWLDESNIPVGQAFVAQLGEALRKSDAFLLVDTPASRASYWVSREIGASIRYQREGRYQAVLRACAPSCRVGEESHWDASLTLDARAHERIAERVSARARPWEAVPEGRSPEGVSIEGNGLGQPSSWSGRQQELRMLDEWWHGPTRGAWVQGMGGLGKSGLVQTWITALACLGYEEPVTATVLHLAGREVVDTADAIGKLTTWQTRASGECKLFFLDGYDEAPPGTDLKGLLQVALRFGSRIVVTSRGSVPSSFLHEFRSFSLHSLSRRDATAVLAEFGITGRDGEAVAAELGDHILALQVFARYVASGERTAAEALEDLRSAREGLEAPQPRPSVQGALERSVSALTPAARRALHALCTVTNPGSAPLVEYDRVQPELIRELARAGLIYVDHLETPTTIAVHPLIRQFVKMSPGDVLEAEPTTR